MRRSIYKTFKKLGRNWTTGKHNLWPKMILSTDINEFKCVTITIRSFPHSWLITRVTRQVSHVEQELLTFRSTWVHSRFLIFSVEFWRSLFVLLPILISVLYCLSLFYWPLLVTLLVSPIFIFTKGYRIVLFWRDISMKANYMLLFQMLRNPIINRYKFWFRYICHVCSWWKS